MPVHLIAQQTPAKQPPASAATRFAGAKGFDTPEQAADALVSAADPYDKEALAQIFGPISTTSYSSVNRLRSSSAPLISAAQAHEKKSVAVDPKNGNRAFLLVGNEEWPFPVPLVKSGANGISTAKPGARSSYTAVSAPMSWTPFKSATALWRRRRNMLSNRVRVIK